MGVFGFFRFFFGFLVFGFWDFASFSLLLLAKQKALLEKCRGSKLG